VTSKIARRVEERRFGTASSLSFDRHAMTSYSITLDLPVRTSESQLKMTNFSSSKHLHLLQPASITRISSSTRSRRVLRHPRVRLRWNDRGNVVERDLSDCSWSVRSRLRAEVAGLLTGDSARLDRCLNGWCRGGRRWRDVLDDLLRGRREGLVRLSLWREWKEGSQTRVSSRRCASIHWGDGRPRAAGTARSRRRHHRRWNSSVPVRLDGLRAKVGRESRG
jgi:hypothetical protein